MVWTNAQSRTVINAAMESDHDRRRKAGGIRPQDHARGKKDHDLDCRDSRAQRLPGLEAQLAKRVDRGGNPTDKRFQNVLCNEEGKAMNPTLTKLTIGCDLVKIYWPHSGNCVQAHLTRSADGYTVDYDARKFRVDGMPTDWAGKEISIALHEIT
jgi:hypothetical protein